MSWDADEIVDPFAGEITSKDDDDLYKLFTKYHEINTLYGEMKYKTADQCCRNTDQPNGKDLHIHGKACVPTCAEGTDE